MTGESLYPRHEPLLAQIQKPIQYVGGELNAQVKPWDGAAVHWALMYPDAYEVGLPNQGLMILYEVLNERPDALAERTYAVWPDLAALMRENGVPAAVTRTRDDVPARIGKRTVMDLDEWPYPKTPIVPLAESVHERMSVEIFRGCTRGCRFCQAGMITRPVRERTITGIGSMVDAGLRATGYEDVGLLSLSSADHSEIGQPAKAPADRDEGTN